MPRPPRCRRVASLPGTTYFKPAGVPLRSLDEVQLSVDETEAIRLKDLEGVEQEEGAVKMDVSRATFQRILTSARRKLADALLNGKAIRIEGGNFELAQRHFRCAQGHEWGVPNAAVTDGSPVLCPACNAPAVAPVLPEGIGWRHGGRREMRRHRVLRIEKDQTIQQSHEEVQQ